MAYAFLFSMLVLTHNYFTVSIDIQPNISRAMQNVSNMLASKIIVNATDDSNTRDYNIYQNGTENPDSEIDYLDFSLLDPVAVKDLHKTAQRKNMMAEMVFNRTVGRSQYNWYEAYYDNPFFNKKTLDLMKQSIYATRYRLRDTKPIRKKYSNDPAYSTAIIYGSLMQLRIKMDNIYTTMANFHPDRVKIIYYLGLYERCLGITVDVTDAVQRMFALKKQMRDSKDYDGKGPYDMPFKV